MMINRDPKDLFVSTKDMGEDEKKKLLKELALIAEKGKRTGKVRSNPILLSFHLYVLFIQCRPLHNDFILQRNYSARSAFQQINVLGHRK